MDFDSVVDRIMTVLIVTAFGCLVVLLIGLTCIVIRYAI